MPSFRTEITKMPLVKLKLCKNALHPSANTQPSSLSIINPVINPSDPHVEITSLSLDYYLTRSSISSIQLVH